MRRLVFAACIAGALALAPPSRRVRRVFACHALALRGGVGGAPPSASVVAAATGAVSRLVALGFAREQAAEAFLACDRNEMLAANFLMDHQ